MRSIYTVAILFILLTSCTRAPLPSFTQYGEEFLTEYWELFPEAATYNGYREYDTIVPIMSEAHRNEVRTFANKQLRTLARYELDSLSPREQLDHLLLTNTARRLLWEIDTLRAYTWNPTYFNIGPTVGMILKGTHAPLSERITVVMKRLAQAPAYYKAAIESISDPTREHITLAIEQHFGTMQLLRHELPDSLDKAGIPDSARRLLMVDINTAAVATLEYMDYLESLKRKGSLRPFPLGADLYEQAFQYELVSSFSPDSLLSIALAQKEEAHTQMLRLTQKLWSSYFDETLTTVDFSHVKQLIDRLSNDHARPQDFQNAIRTQLDSLVDFVNEKGLVHLDSTKPLIVREAPGYLKGISLVSISAPGPGDPDAPTYYNVNNLLQYDTATAESWLREYNDWMLQILNIHEAIPGHYTQLVYANKSPSTIATIFGSNTMVEGWACYAERMMLENGWGNDADELWLLYYKWYLRIISNTICDISVQTKGWTREQVMQLLVDEAFQEKAEAENKWLRIERTNVQLCSYFNGLMEILDLRDEMMARQGDNFDLRNFHDQFLSYGSAPVSAIRKAMLMAAE